MQMEKKKAVLYARTSQDEEEGDSTTSVPEQLAACRELADHQEYVVVGELSDKNRSGRTYPAGVKLADTDPVFQRYYQEHIGVPARKSRKGLAQVFGLLDEIDVIVVRDETRLMRPLLNSYLETHIWQSLSEHGVILHSVSEGIISPDDHDQQMLSRLKATTKDKDVLLRVKTCKDSLRRLRDEGKLFCSPTFYGFKSNGRQKVRSIPSQLKAVQRIYEMFLSDVSMLEICRTLNGEAIPTQTGKRGAWMYRTVRAILERPQYTGYQPNSTGELVRSEAFFPHRVISLDDFQRVQARFAKRRRYTRVVKKIHPLSGLVFCGVCGKHLYTFKGKTRYEKGMVDVWYYRCKYGSCYHRDTPDCRKVLIRETNPPDSGTVNRQGWTLREFVTPFIQTAFIQYLRDKHRRAGLDDELERVESELARIEEIEQKLLDKLMDGVVSDDQFDNLMLKHKKRRETLTAYHEELEADFNAVPDLAPLFADTSKRDHFNLSPEEFRDLCHQALKRLDVFPGKVKVTLANDGVFEVERLRVRNSRLLPEAQIRFHDDNFDLNTKITVTFLYKSARDGIHDPVVTVYQDANLKVVTHGTNELKTVKKNGKRIRPSELK